MSVHQDIHDNLVDNPVAWREFLTLFRQRGKWFWRVLYALSLLLFLLPLLWTGSNHFDDAISVVMGLLIFANVLIYPLVVVRSITTTNESVSRERRGKTWDLLMLTGVGTWRVVLGKWLGSMRFLARDYLWLFLLRFGTIFWVATRDGLYNTFGYYNSNSWQPISVMDIRFDLSRFALVMGLILVFTVLELMFSSALGIATAFFNWRSRTGGGVALGVRVGLAVALLFGTMYAVGYFNPYPYYPDYPQHTDDFIMTFAITSADNGVISSGRLLMGNYLDDKSEMAIKLALGVHILLYLVLTGIVLEVARTVSLHVGINNPGALSVKSKRKNIQEAPVQAAPAPAPERTLVLAAGASNVFEVQSPERVRAEVYHYQRRLGRLYLRLTGSGESTYVQLSNVAYIEAPAVWTGAKFRTATQSEYEAFVQSKGLSISHLTADAMRLYVLDGDNPVRIVAGSAQIMDEPPATI